MRRLVGLLLCVGCNAGGHHADERPAFLGTEHTASVQLIAGLERGIGSGVAVDATHVLTAWHVVDELGSEDGGLVFRSRSREVRATYVDGAEELDQDWALIEVEAPRWSPEQAAVLADAPAVVGEVLWAVGYPMSYYPPGPLDPRLPPRVVRVVVAEPNPATPQLVLAQGRGVDLSGMSGGGVFRWNDAAGRLELVGTLIGQSEEDRYLDGPLGVSLTIERRERIRIRALPPSVRARLRE